MKKIIGVMGPGKKATDSDLKNAYEIGKFCAEQEWVVLTGGLKDGVMNEALKGAKENNGLTLGILPGDDKQFFSEYLDLAIPTNMRGGRNYINALSSDLVLACGMGAGTSSEISLSIKSGKKVILVGLFDEANNFYRKLGNELTYIAKDYTEAIDILKKELK